jgi:hypothetical protein
VGINRDRIEAGESDRTARSTQPRPDALGASSMAIRRLALVITLLVAPNLVVAQSAPGPAIPPIPDPCVTAPNLPYCK